jgi:hypothetical protein
MYDDVVNENIPDDFMGFLEQADERRAGGAGGEGPGDEPDPEAGA